VKKSNIHWHKVLGRLFELLLIPVGVKVYVGKPVMKDLPESDIIFLRLEGDTWTPAQKAYLPDGIRESDARHVLIEFKYSESLNKKAIRQTTSYQYWYCQSEKLEEDDLKTVIVVSKTPRKQTLQRFGYNSMKAGVYRSNDPLADDIGLIILNELPPVAYNAYIKLFASRKREQEAAVKTLSQSIIQQSASIVVLFVKGIIKMLSIEDVIDVDKEEITPDDIMEYGRRLFDEYLQGLSPEERLIGLRPEERLIGLRPEERLAGLASEDVLLIYKPEERLAGLRPEERLIGLRPEERLIGLTREEIEAYLQTLDSSNDMTEIQSVDVTNS